MGSENSLWNRRNFLKVGGTSAAALGVVGSAAVSAQAAQAPAAQAGAPPDTPYPKLSIITPYSPLRRPFGKPAMHGTPLTRPWIHN